MPPEAASFHLWGVGGKPPSGAINGVAGVPSEAASFHLWGVGGKPLKYKIMENSGRNHTDSKYYNQALLLRLILSQGPVSRLALARLSGLSPAALTVLVGALLEEGLLVEVDNQKGFIPRVGRRSVPLDLNTKSGFALGIHITPRVTRVGLVNLKGEIVDQMRGDPPGREPARTIAGLAQLSRDLMARNAGPVVGVGVGAVGLVERDKGLNFRALSLGWQNVPIKALFENELGLPVLVDNNARAMTLGELLFGYGRSHNYRNIALIYIGTGVGGGIALDGQLYWGSGSAAGEIGHMIIDPLGPPCYCGARGCVEQFAGEAAMLREAQELGLKPLETASNSANLTMEDLLEAAKQGDPGAVEIIRQAGRAIGIAVTNTYRVLNPDTIIIAGRIARAQGLFLEAVRKEAGKSGIAPESEMNILEASLGDNIGLIGAAALVLGEYLFTQRPLAGVSLVAR